MTGLRSFTRVVSRVAVALFVLCSPAASLAVPAIAITSLPPYGSSDPLAGVVSGVDPATHGVAVYIQIEGAGWWTKPTQVAPVVSIDPNGGWSTTVVTGGLDAHATVLCAALLGPGVSPPVALGSGRIPASLSSLDMDCERRSSRTVVFAGRTWAVKEAPLPVGPGLNVFSADPNSVFVDASGDLHLRVRFAPGCHLPAGCWWASEVVLLEELGYGEYRFDTRTEIDALDAGVTFGAFSWDLWGDGAPPSAHREIDVEDGRWGNAIDADAAQFVVQPFGTPGNLVRFAVPVLLGARLEQGWVWSPDRVDFAASVDANPIASLVYTTGGGPGHFVPTPGRAEFRFNLWSNAVALGGPGPPAPSGGMQVEVVIEDFRYAPLVSAPTSSGSALLIALCVVGAAAFATLAWRKARS